MNRVLLSLLAGGAFVAVTFVLGHRGVATPAPFLLLSPGIAVGVFVPGADFNPEGDTHPWGLLSRCVAFGIDLALYGGLAYAFLPLLRLGRRMVK